MPADRKATAPATQAGAENAPSTRWRIAGMKKERHGTSDRTAPMPLLRSGDEKMAGALGIDLGVGLFLRLFQRRMPVFCSGMGPHVDTAGSPGVLSLPTRSASSKVPPPAGLVRRRFERRHHRRLTRCPPLRNVFPAGALSPRRRKSISGRQEKTAAKASF